MEDGRIDSARRQKARRLREMANDAEKRLWRYLRRYPIQGSHFRRQVPIGPYVADFACMAARLLIELDGSQHARPANQLRDQARTRWLEKEGFRVVRIWNNEIIQNIDGVMEKIFEEIYGAVNAEPAQLRHRRRKRAAALITPPRALRARPSPSRGG
jgi:very-short-patch-repair endonuclease